MEKKYITPKIKVREVETDSLMVEGSGTVNSETPTTGIPGGNSPVSGGTATGGNAGSATSKFNLWTTGVDEE